MRAPSAAMFPNAVTVRTRTVTNTRGRQVEAWTETATTASVQPRRADRLIQAGLLQSEVTHIAYFAADPGVSADDQIVWSGGTLSVLSKARDQAGRGGVFAVDCREVA